MIRALGWWRHVALAGVAVGLLISPAAAAPGGWLLCLAVGAVAAAWAGRQVLDPARPSTPAAAHLWLVGVLALGGLAGLGAGSFRLASIERGALQAPSGSSVSASGFVTGFPQSSFGEVRVPVETSGGSVLVVVPEPADIPSVGSEVEVRGEVATPEEGFARSRVERAGAVVELRAESLAATGGARGGVDGALDRVRDRAGAALAVGMSEKQSALARGFVLGQDDAIDPATREAFKRSGLSHLLAVSGQNVMLLAILGGALFALFGSGLRMRLVLTLLLIAAYVPIAGAGPSIQRAGVMAAAAILATLAGGASERAYPLLLAAVVTLLIDPRFGSDVGWQLSFAAVVGITLWAGPIRERLTPRLASRLPRRLAAPMAEGTALTIAATVSTVPLIAHVFGQVSLVALPANLAALPAIAPVMWIGMAMGLLAQLPVTSVGPVDPMAWMGFVEGRLIDYVAWVARAFAAPPWAQVEFALPGIAAPLATALAAGSLLTLVLLALARRDGLRSRPAVGFGLALVVLLLLIPGAARRSSVPDGPPPGSLRITELDVGQGDATLLQTARGSPVLVDGGPPGTAASDQLTALGIDRLRAVVVTHDDLDHAGGLATVLDRFEVDEFVRARPAPELEAMAAGADIPVDRVAEGSSLRFGRLKLDVIWPPRDDLTVPAPDRNAAAIVAVARFRSWRALLSGDAEQEVTRLDPGPIDVLKVAHHGSEDGGLGSLLDRSVPQVALIGVGADNPYGHPAEATTGALAERAVCTLRTDLDGAAAVELGPSGLSAWTEDGRLPTDRAGCESATG